jgi:hypothetical protein
MTGTKPTNPKDLIGSTKLPYHLWPETATAVGVLALLDGALKYGRSNWRVAGVRASIYIDACRRHLAAWFEGEDNAPDSGLPHLGHALACLAILVDAQAANKLTDDRMVLGGYDYAFRVDSERVKMLLEKYKTAPAPQHYTIADTPAPDPVLGGGTTGVFPPGFVPSTIVTGLPPGITIGHPTPPKWYENEQPKLELRQCKAVP